MEYVYANQECSSGCESGWTLYLEHSSISPEASYDQGNCSHGRRNRVCTEAKRLKEEVEEEDEEEEDEDLSMVSDASSGPPHLHEEEGYGGSDNNGCFHHCIVEDSLSTNSLNKKKKVRENRRRDKVQDQSSLLDDTASSPLFDFSNKSFNLTRSQPAVENVLEYSQGYSTTQFEVRPPYQQHYDFFQSGNQMQQQNQW